MNSCEPIKPRDRLLAVAQLWSEATGRTFGALSAKVTNHGGTLDRLSDPANAVTDTTLERFARFLADPANWPECDVPEEAREFAHVTGVSVADGGASTGHAGDVSGVERAA